MTAPSTEVAKIRRVDFYSDDWLAGTSRLTLEERGAYITLCAMIYSTSDRLEDDDKHIAAVCGVDPRVWRRIKGRLIDLGKLRVEDGFLRNLRCTSEVTKGVHRVLSSRQAGEIGGRNSASARREINRLPEATAQAPAQAQPTTTNHQPTISSPPSPSSARANQAQPTATAVKSPSAEQSTGDANPDADRVVSHFVAERQRLWPRESGFPSAHVTLRSQASAFLGQGGSAALVCEVLTRQMAKAVAAGKSAPANLRAYRHSLGDAIAGHRAQPEVTTPRERRGETLAEQDARVKRFREENMTLPSEQKKATGR